MARCFHSFWFLKYIRTRDIIILPIKRHQKRNVRIVPASYFPTISVCFQGEQTVDVSAVFSHLPYIINFCNLTQVKKTSGFVRQVRRAQQAAYPLTKVPADEFVFQPPSLGELRMFFHGVYNCVEFAVCRT